MSRKQQHQKTSRTAGDQEKPAERLTAQAVRGAAAGVARSITDWILAQLTEDAD